MKLECQDCETPLERKYLIRKAICPLCRRKRQKKQSKERYKLNHPPFKKKCAVCGEDLWTSSSLIKFHMYCRAEGMRRAHLYKKRK